MTLDITLTLIAIFALLIFAAFFAGAETALTPALPRSPIDRTVPPLRP